MEITKKKCKIKESWIKAELSEHGKNFPKNIRRKMAKNIATNHVDELGCKYYPSLFKMESKLKRGKK